MNMLIEQMLEAARLEEGRLHLRLEQVDLCEVASAAIEVVSPLADARHPVVLECGPEPVPARVDRERVSTILSNLLDNAIKYSPAGGEVRCKVWGQNGRAFVSVQDHGLGIAAEDQPRLFGRFSRVITSENQHIPGTGLGLYLSRELARRLDGDLGVESAPGAGSTFTLTVPGALAPAEPQPNPPPLTVLESTG
jgi:signal transduction histidine kinase